MNALVLPVLLVVACCPISAVAVEKEAPGTEASVPAVSNSRGAEAGGQQKKQSGTMDKLALDATTITGNRELPKVMYIVPWKRADIGDPGGEPLRSLVDEVLEPVEREVFNREISYFRALEPAPERQVDKPIPAGQGKP